MEQDWNIQTIKNGFLKEGALLTCIFCGQEYDDNYVYPLDEHFAKAETMMAHHLKKIHGGVVPSLLALNKSESGLSEVQRTFLGLVQDGLSDEEIAENLNVTKSAVRNHRFKLKEKKRQAKVLIALLEAMEEQTDQPFSANAFQPLNKKDETQQVLSTFLDKEGRAKRIPVKEKKRLILFKKLMERFLSDKEYTEKEVNQLIGEMFDDAVTVRRYLIEYGFLGRTIDGQKYWVI